MEIFPKELKEDPVPLVAVTVLPGSTDVLSAETLVAAYRADLARAPERLRVTVFDPAPLALRRPARRETFATPGTPPPSASSSTPQSSPPPLSSPASPQVTSESPAAATPAARGILRTNWFHKHTAVVPAVVLALASVRRADQWPAVEAAVAAFASAWRAVAAYRRIRIAFVIVVENSSSSGSSISASTGGGGGSSSSSLALEERLAQLRRRADVEARQVLVCAGPAARWLQGAAARGAVAELAGQHYRDEARRLKQLARSLPRGAPFQLHARLAVKAGFVAEQRGDAHRALQHYTAAFARLTEAALLEARRPESLLLHETKVVAWLVMYRMCALHFQRFHSLGEAVRCFALFARTFRDAYAVPAFQFAHLAWLAACHEDFAYLLLTNVNAARGNRGAMHPWAYFRAAAQLMRRRARAARLQCVPYKDHPSIVAAKEALIQAGFVPVASKNTSSDSSDSTTTTTDSATNSTTGLESSNSMTTATSSSSTTTTTPGTTTPGTSIYEQPSQYYGQFTQWKTADGRELGEDAHRTMAWELFFFDHGAAALALYERALVLLRAMPHSARTLLEVQTQVAALHADAGAWAQAKRCCDAVAPRYAAEGWADLVADTRAVARRCAMHLRCTDEFLANSLALLPPSAPLEKSAKTAIQSDMEAVLQGVGSGTGTGTSTSAGTDTASSSSPDPVLSALVLDHRIVQPVVEVADGSALLRVACRFVQGAAFVGDAAPLEVTVTSFFPAPVIFATMRLFFTDARNDLVHRHSEQSLTEHLRFAPDVPRVFRFAVRPAAVQELACRAVELALGPHDNANVVFHWDNPAVDVGDDDSDSKSSKSTSESNSSNGNSDDNTGTYLHVQAKKSVVKVKARHAGPALCGELFEFVLQVRNDDAQPVTETRISCACGGSGASHAGTFFLDAAGRQALPVLAVAAVPAHAGFEQPVYVRAPRVPGALEVVVNVAFRTAAGAPGVTALRERVPVQEPFAVAFAAHTAALQPLDMLAAGAHGTQPFYLCAQAQPTTPFALELTGVNLDLSSSHEEETEEEENKEKDEEGKNKKEAAFTLITETATRDLAEGPKTLGAGAHYATWFLVRAAHETQQVEHPGTLTLRCRRAGSEQVLTQTCAVPALRSSSAFLAVTRHCPTTAPLGTAVTDRVRVENQGAGVRVLTIAVAPPPAGAPPAPFLLAGATATTVAVMPRSARTVPLTFVPLATGALPLPDLRITTSDHQQIVCPRLTLFVTPPLPQVSS